jgi:hypothetical protein
MARLLILLLMLVTAAAGAQDTPPILRLRGVVESFASPNLVIRERSGKMVSLTLPPETGITEVLPTDITAVQPGSFIGTAAVARADGKLTSLEVVLFPEEARGIGEGHFPWDLRPDSSITNATVSELARSSEGRIVRLRYKEGEQTIVVPDGVPVVTLRPGERFLIVPGAKLFVVAESDAGELVVRRLLVGRNGFQPPM